MVIKTHTYCDYGILRIIIELTIISTIKITSDDKGDRCLRSVHHLRIWFAVIMIIMIKIKRSCNYCTNACTYHAVYVNMLVFLCVLFCMGSCVDIGQAYSHWLSNKMFEFEVVSYITTNCTMIDYTAFQNSTGIADSSRLVDLYHRRIESWFIQAVKPVACSEPSHGPKRC